MDYILKEREKQVAFQRYIENKDFFLHWRISGYNINAALE